MTEEKKSVSEELMDDLEPINNMVDEGGPIHPTEFDESDDIEAAKNLEAVKAIDELMVGIKDEEMDYSGAFESDIIEEINTEEEKLPTRGEVAFDAPWLEELGVKKGDIVGFEKNRDYRIKIDGQEYYRTRAEDLMYIIEENV